MTDQSIFQGSYPSPLGPIQILGDREGLLALHFKEKEDGFPALKDLNPGLDQRLQEDFSAYFQGRAVDFSTLPFHLQGTPFQVALWTLTASIPYGQLVSYGDLARALAKDLGKKAMSAQAVGTGLGKNPLAILIPCHRVIAAKQKIGGYSGGLPLKRYLLNLEGHALTEDRILF